MGGLNISETLLLSLKIGLLATLVNMPLALLIVYWLSHKKFRGKSLVEGIINLPLVMPPVTTGYLLLFVLGKKGLIGSFLFSLFGLRIAFTSAAAVIASMVVSFPLVVRSLRISMDMVDPRLERAALTLGAGKAAVFFRVTLPLIMPGVLNALVLGFARSLGEFGATMTFAGNIVGETRTIPLSVYSFLQVPGKEREAGILVLISIAVSFMAMFLSSHFQKNLQRRRVSQHEPSL